MIRVVGESSAAHALGIRMGDPLADGLWLELSDSWLAECAERVVENFVPAMRANLRLEIARVLDPRLNYFLLRRLAREFYSHRKNISECWAWDAWVVRDTDSQLGILTVTLKSIVSKLVAEGRLEAWRQSECPTCYRSVHGDAPEAPTTWRSLHPCACVYP